MKKFSLLILLFLSFSGLYAQDDAISKFFSKYMEDENFSRVYISPKMMQMAGGFLKSGESSDQEAQELGELISKVRGIRILSAENVNGKPLYEEAMGTLSRNKYEDLMDVADKLSNTKFMVREENGRIMELLMVSGSPESFTLLSMLGNFTYEDLNILADKTNLPGMEKYNNKK
jgi:hypothetical protein